MSKGMNNWARNWAPFSVYNLVWGHLVLWKDVNLPVIWRILCLKYLCNSIKCTFAHKAKLFCKKYASTHTFFIHKYQKFAAACKQIKGSSSAPPRALLHHVCANCKLKQKFQFLLFSVSLCPQHNQTIFCEIFRGSLLSNLWWMSKPVSKTFYYAMRTDSSRRFVWYPT